MFKYLIFIAYLFLTASLIGCHIKTPEIRGVVLDEETKRPVEEAWISATLGIRTKTIQGNVSSYLSVENPHTRTDSSGSFVIPTRSFKKPSFPFGFGTEVESFSINASTIDDKSGGFYLKGYEGKEDIEVTIYVKPWEKGLNDEKEYFSYLQALYNYCLTGRFGVEIPPVEGGCDEWELNYTIAKHERYLDKFKTVVDERGYSTAFDQLAYLYEKRGDYRSAIQTLRKSITIMEIKGLLRFEVWQRNRKEIEWKINELQKKLEGVKK